ncbi:mechanosensitive channel MscK [Halopseudomonas maritima]|uniref:mechanosensitive channel MscK n=1 Tax=Halopseudomonas maritima TaxID=2918528 RepID=UPI001EEB6CBE|nr:mechanosensitive channel MscK [Halopseudomonas maritima]UJJ30617.1 mechanosensitive channel MscK [Halopseudomonas maritima]
MLRLPLLLCWLFFSSWALAQQNTSADELDQRIEALTANIDSVSNSSLPEAEKRELTEAYQSTLTFLRQTRQTLDEQQQLQETLASAPRQTQSVRAQLNSLSKADSGGNRSQLEQQSLSSLETRLREQVAQMFTWQNELTTVNGQLIAAQTRPERTQASVTENQTRSQQLNDQLRNQQRLTPSQLTRARIEQLQAELDYLQANSELMRQRLAGNGVLQDLATQQKNLLTLQIKRIEEEIRVLQSVVNGKRQDESEQTVSDATLLEGQSQNKVLQAQSSINRQLSEELLNATRQIGVLTLDNIETQQQTEQLTQIDKALEQQIEVLEGSLLLSRILHQQKSQLPKVETDKNLADQIADLRLHQFELNQLAQSLDNPDAYLNDLLLKIPAAQRDNLRPALEQMVSARINLVEQLNGNINTLINLAITLQINQRQLQQLSSDLKRTIDDQLFWVASSRPIDRSWLTDLPNQVAAQIDEMNLPQQARHLVDAITRHWIASVLVLLALGLHLWRRPKLLQRIDTLHDEVGHFRRDSSWHTPLALLLTAIRVADIPLLLLSVGLLILLDTQQSMPAVGTALIKLSLAWFALHLMYRVFDPRGIATRHFHWDESLVQRLRKLVRNLAWVLLPLVLVLGLHGSLPEYVGTDAAGRTGMLLGMFVLAFLLGRFMLRSEPLYSSRILHYLASALLILSPLALAGLTAWGYHYTAVKLAERFIDSLYLIVLWMLLEGTVVRNLNVAGRRLAYQRAVSKRQAAQTREAQSDTEVAVEIPEMNLQQINQQSLRLAKLTLVIIFTIGLYFTWADLISATSYLESVTLWHYEGTGLNAGEAVPISVGDILGALVTVVLTITLARNLPGLLEILVLSRLELRQGSSYAITTLLSYVIIGFGLVSSLSTLGVSWDKLQWLVAALGVGLGFGLQEIFANFISGLIILFERPVRIGDVVTIGPLSGTINRIRIRATTITDFDRKEIIVPNKNFVTEQIINWSLQDTITRVIIKVGVAYGSDVSMVRKLLLQIAQNNPRVLKDPEPLVFFLNFAESTLDHELRIHVKELADRNMAIDEINREIDRLFKENDIEIAFRQLDVNLRTSKGLEKLVQSYRIDEKDSANATAETPHPPAAQDPITPGDQGDGSSGADDLSPR